MCKQKTLTGFNLDDLADLLDQPLHSSAYKAVGGADYLTDISAVWQRRVFNKVFGMFGIGWGLDILPEHIISTENGKGIETSLKGMFWFKYLEDGKTKKVEFLVTGAHKDARGNMGYSMKGAYTNAVGFGGSCLGWQESVYMGIRSHNNPSASAPGRKIFKSLEEIMALKESGEPKPEETPKPAEKPTEKAGGAVKEKQPEPKPEVSYWNCAQCGFTFVTDHPEDGVACGHCQIDMVRANSEKEMVERSELIQKQLAEKETAKTETTTPPHTNDDGMKYPVCTDCGYYEAVNVVSKHCSGCGVSEANWSMQASLKAAEKMSANIRDIVANKNSTAKKEKEELIEEAKKLANNDRRLLLQYLTKAAGKSIKSYAKATTDEIKQAIELLADSKNRSGQDSQEQKEEKPNLQGMSKTEKVKHIFQVGIPALGNIPAILAKISSRVGRKITSSNELNPDELDGIYTTWVLDGKVGE